jgi:hypothetical protein
MKPLSKSLLGAVGLLVSAWSFTGCTADAEDTNASSVVATNAQAPNASIVSNETGKVSTTKEAPNAPSLGQEPVSISSVATTNDAASEQPLVVIPPKLPADIKLSKAAQEIVKLAESGVGDSVILLYVEKSDQRFDLNASDLIYLNDIGISTTVVTAMLAHDGASPDLQHPLTNKMEVATSPAAPPPGPVPAQPGPFDITTNYVATMPPPPLLQDPNAQPQYIVQQPPTVVDQEPVVVGDPADSYSYFYSSLSPYGSWVVLPDYGWCWRPSIAVVHSGWRPYCHGGRWLYSDCGWYWHSDYSWGWAPFHYGRWYCSPTAGWVWTPGYTWGPSWVTWRRSGDYCGWAPLPPHTHVRSGVGFTFGTHDVGFGFGFGLRPEHYTFVAAHDFYNRRVIDHVIPTERTHSIYKNSTVVDNYAVGKNNTVINNGINHDFIASHTLGDLHKVSIRDESRAATRAVPPDRLQRSGNDLVVYRPTPPAPTVTAARQLESRTAAETHRSSDVAAASGTVRNLTQRPETPAPRTAASASMVPNRAVHPPATSSPRPDLARSEVSYPNYGTPLPIKPEPPQTVNAARPARTALETRTPIANTSTGLRGGNEARIAANNVPENRTPSFSNNQTTPASVARSQAMLNNLGAERSEATRPPEVPAPRPFPQTTAPNPVLQRRAENTQPAPTASPRPVYTDRPFPQAAPANPAPNANLLPPRSEVITGRPLAPSVQNAAPIYQPRAITPAPRETYSTPPQSSAAYSAPARSSAAPNMGGAPRYSAPPASVSRPAAPAPNTSSSSRGRVEIGR